MFRRLNIRRFLHRDDGSASIEAVLWLPLFVYMLCLIVDASMVFHTHSRILGVIQDVNRSLALGRITDTSVAENTVKSRLVNYGSSVNVTSKIEDGVINTTVSIPFRNVQVLGVLPSSIAPNLTVAAFQYKEM
ncbi:pilus assembly protein [Sinirhodobacter sp. WL0062]|uniref:Pilus assembly protein n=1 Tax=Rhodobacter flavimaris TaxID=2907145 RepID=A0ABS8YUE6_9RHOB|nr:TadE/TadG family type IV pilus assembly protein [Sinirhodobacter sp. WL0062]MCE5972139.1 pilus assembly protein [Sinirhodobacter sp. WL0062]